ncbi:sodium:proton antiporter [Fusibacter ferrireducens]|uniref:Cation:proton antiporter subunit C n=1 Tax=Fusibacter ferrireducens TaxID=2785058 RepID=A0ABR9ZX08_9FIRM|nr:cation:proton antiporter subunit C [Fusibacter ferrireducens]MBF4694144.1 cation:proton antiporter subunit C [Fusibacter ferrireducens]
MTFEKLLDLINGENVSLALFMIGIYALASRRNIVKTIIALSIIQAAIILFFLSINNSEGRVPPIGHQLSVPVADPIPQALMITAIVVGISVTAVSLTMFISLYHKYGSTNWNKVKNKRGGLR